MKLASRKSILITLAAMSLSAVALNAKAVNLVQNGSFEINGGNGQLGFNTSAPPWVNGTNTSSGQLGYNFVFNAGPGISGTTADTTGALGQYGNVQLWGPGNGSNNGLSPSPDGGAFLALDGVFQPAPVTQSISGLTPGQNYDLSFYYAGAQQFGPNFTEPTTEAFQVNLGDDPSTSQTTPSLNNAGEGFTGWNKETLTFKATSATETLSFLALGTSTGNQQPPFSLLDGVSLTPSSVITPEPETDLALVLLGLGMLGVRLARKKQKNNA